MGFLETEGLSGHHIPTSYSIITIWSSEPHWADPHDSDSCDPAQWGGLGVVTSGIWTPGSLSSFRKGSYVPGNWHRFLESFCPVSQVGPKSFESPNLSCPGWAAQA